MKLSSISTFPLFGKLFELITEFKPLHISFGTKSETWSTTESWVLHKQSFNVTDPLTTPIAPHCCIFKVIGSTYCTMKNLSFHFDVLLCGSRIVPHYLRKHAWIAAHNGHLKRASMKNSLLLH